MDTASSRAWESLPLSIFSTLVALLAAVLTWVFVCIRLSFPFCSLIGSFDCNLVRLCEDSFSEAYRYCMCDILSVCCFDMGPQNMLQLICMRCLEACLEMNCGEISCSIRRPSLVIKGLRTVSFSWSTSSSSHRYISYISDVVYQASDFKPSCLKGKLLYLFPTHPPCFVIVCNGLSHKV